MTTFTEQITETYHLVSCATCSVRFGIPDGLYLRAVKRASGSIFCPACGRESVWRESEDQKRIKDLEKKLAWEASECARQKSARDAAEASLIATRGVVTRLKRRASAGVCPCCNRTFKQLSQHMANKHPEFMGQVEAGK